MPPSAPHDAETIALLAAAYLGSDEERLSGLLSLSGMTPADAKAAMQAREPGFLGHILDYLLSNEAWAEEFAQSHDLTPQDLDSAARAYGAGRLMD